LKDQRERGSHRETKSHFADGLHAFVRDLNHHRKPLHDIVSGTKTVKFSKDGQPDSPIEVEFAFQYTDDSHTIERYFVNTLETTDGGTHQAGLRTALTRTINKRLRGKQESQIYRTRHP
jgi:DNA gyrase/topoisomerase IV subunit B